MEVISVPNIYNDYYEISIGLIFTSILLIIFSLLLYSLNSTVHTWMAWVILVLFALLFIGIGLLSLYYKYNNIVIIT